MIHVLLVEDNPGDARLVSEYLDGPNARRYELTHVSRISDAIARISSGAPIDVIISDIALPDAQGTQSFQKLQDASADLPVIFCTGTHDERMAVNALQRGAQDYLLKGQFEGETLRRSIRYAIERKKSQKEAERARVHARRLRQRTEQLRRESSQLIALNKAKDEFISLASHQLRTPATGVKQYVGLLLEGYTGPLTAEQRRFLQMANDSNERQLKIVSDLLRTAQIDAGRIQLSRTETDLVALLQDIVGELQDQFNARQQTVATDMPAAAIRAAVDHDRLRMALENIVDNASKYTPPGRSVSVSLVEAADDVTITVHDEGVGIAPADLPRVFDKFSRVDNPLSNDVGGSGLGLYWTKKIIDLHGGTIRVVSATGKGSDFVVRLPKVAQITAGAVPDHTA